MKQTPFEFEMMQCVILADFTSWFQLLILTAAFFSASTVQNSSWLYQFGLVRKRKIWKSDEFRTLRNIDSFLHSGVTRYLLYCNGNSYTILTNNLYVFVFFLNKKYLKWMTSFGALWMEQGGSYRRPHQQERPIVGVCERCRQQQPILSNSLSWAAPGLSHWGTPPKLTAIQQRSFRGPFHPTDELF